MRGGTRRRSAFTRSFYLGLAPWRLRAHRVFRKVPRLGGRAQRAIAGVTRIARRLLCREEIAEFFDLFRERASRRETVADANGHGRILRETIHDLESPTERVGHPLIGGTHFRTTQCHASR